MKFAPLHLLKARKKARAGDAERGRRSFMLLANS